MTPYLTLLKGEDTIKKYLDVNVKIPIQSLSLEEAEPTLVVDGSTKTLKVIIDPPLNTN